ncbi:hypothetical protein BGZ49_000467, partial [Haplosporangium sp. Z 27]
IWSHKSNSKDGTKDGDTSSIHSSSEIPRERKRDKIRSWLKPSSQELSPTGPFFPRSNNLLPSQLISQATDDLRGVPCAFDDAKDTNTVVVSFIAADEGAQSILRDQIYDIIKQFDNNLVTLDAVRELVILGRIPEKDVFLQITEKLLRVIRDSISLSTIALQGLAVALNSCPKEINMSGEQGFYLDILGALKQRLETVRSEQNECQLIPLLNAITALLNAMVCRNLHAVDRERIFQPLNSILGGLKSHDNTTVNFLASYALQGLAYVGNDESLEMSIYRHGRLAIMMGIDIASGVSNVDLGKFVDAYSKFKELNDFSFKASWYQGLVYLDCTLELQDWIEFETFILKSKLKSDERFLQGVCLRLEQIAMTESSKDINNSSVEFLHFLRVNPAKDVQQVALATLERLGISYCTKHRTANSKLHTATIKCGCSITQIVRNDLPPVWDRSWYSTSSATLLKAVQQTRKTHSIIENIPAQHSETSTGIQSIQTGIDKVVDSLAATCGLGEVHAALESYYKSSLVIQRVSGDTLDLKMCYINLAIVEAPGQRKKDKSDLKTQANTFRRIPSREESIETNMQLSIPLENIFDKRELRDGNENEPKRILIHGRAGIGKSTLCKKIVHSFQAGQWRDRFDIILWLPLRQLKSYKSRNIDDLLSEKYFSEQHMPERTALSRTLSNMIQAGRVLFVLDGLDEIVTSSRSEEGHALKEFIQVLLRQEHVVITSRPSGVDKSILPDIDLEMETVGFSVKNVRDYLPIVLPPDQVQSVQEFIDRTPVVQGLVNIPVQLDVICYSWDSLPTNSAEISMTSLYQAMVRKLWCKDAVRLRKSSGGEVLTEDVIHRLRPSQIDKLMEREIDYLGYLAFKGLKDDHRIEFDEEMLQNTLEDLDQNRMRIKPDYQPILQMIEWLKETSFLHTADMDLDIKVKKIQRSWYFLHLTFQEYFAATWLVRHLQGDSGSSLMMMTIEETTEFVLNEKYNPRYEIVWWMVAGQLKGRALASFFDLLQGVPVDLIGGYHYHLIAACLKESRNELDHERVVNVETQLTEWLQFEMANDIKYGGGKRGSILGSMGYLSEELLIRSIGQSGASLRYLTRTLRARQFITPSAIQVLVNTLKVEDRELREFAVELLREQSSLPYSALQDLISALQQDDSYLMDLAAKALGNQSTLPDSALQALMGTLQQDDNYVRDSAVKALGNQSTLPDSVIQALIGAFQDNYSNVRRSAAYALGNKSTLPDSALQALIGTLKDKDWTVRHFAANALRNQSTLSDSALEALIVKLKDKSDEVRYSAATILNKRLTLPASTLQALIDALQDEYYLVRNSAAEALGKQSTLPDSALQALIGALQDKDWNVRESAAKALGEQSTLPDSALQVLIAALPNKDSTLRESVTTTLRKQLILPDSVVQALIDALQDKDSHVRDSAAQALRNQSTLPDPALETLISILNDEDSDVRYSVVTILEKQLTLPASTLQALIGALQDENKRVRSSATTVLLKQSTLPDSALESLVDILQHKDDDVRSLVASILEKQSALPTSTLQTLIDSLQDEDWRVKDSIAKALGEQPILPDFALQALIGALTDKNENVRGSVATTLGNQSALPDSALQALVVTLQDKYWSVRSSAAKALGKQSTLSESALQALIVALKHKNPDVRNSAATLIGKQSTLLESALQGLIDSLQDENVREDVLTVLEQHAKLTFLAIPTLTPSAIEILYETFLIRYGSQYSAALWVKGDRILFHTAQGFDKIDGLCAEDLAKVVEAFDAVKRSKAT